MNKELMNSSLPCDSLPVGKIRKYKRPLPVYGCHARTIHLALDAVLHWKGQSATCVSAWGRWEARRRHLLSRAWIKDHRNSFFRIHRLKNPHHLSLREAHTIADGLSGGNHT